uniref:STI1 domain-containing protein n=1 Tax=Meloidogyne hapla TaxID=6305 RepID=A0A1I8BMC8_MELHA
MQRLEGENPNPYKENAKTIKKAIQMAPKYGQIDTFIDIVKKDIKEKVTGKSAFNDMPKEVEPEPLVLDDLPTIVRKFLKKVEGWKNTARKLFGRS